jgi:lipopolysaccharide export system permease protein
LIVSLISFELDNKWVSKGNEVRYNIEREYMKRRSRVKAHKELRNVFLQKNEQTHISIGRYKVETATGRSIAAISLNEGIVNQRIDARGIKWLDSLNVWNVTDFSIREFNESGAVKNIIISKSDTLLGLNFTPEDITQQSKTPDEMNFADLTKRIEQLKENGVDTTKWEVDRQFKVSFAFTNLIVVLFGLPLVVMKSKGGLSFGAGMGIFVIFIYYAFIKFGMSMGYNGVMSPMVAAWMGNVLFSVGGILLLIIARK